MNVSAILVVVPAAHVDAAVAELSALPGVDVHHVENATGRVVVTLEAVSVDEEVQGLKRIQALPRVILAEMVQHHFEDDPEIAGVFRPDPNDGRRNEVPPLLEEL